MSSSVVRRSLATAVKSTAAVKPTATTTTSKPTKIGIRIQSFHTPLEETLPPYARRVKLPESRVLFTVNRSPHVDKKSREQFSMHTKREYLVLKTDRHELAHKFFWLKRLRILGAQYEVRLSCKTRLDKEMLKQHLSSGGNLDAAPSE